MTRWLALLYGAACYLFTGATVLYTAAFLNDLFVPKSINHGGIGDPTTAAGVDLALILLFGVQHSGMARPGFKRVWTQVLPPPIERSTYVFFSNLVLLLLCALWQPMPVVVWDVKEIFAAWFVWLIAGVGILILAAASFQIDPWELLGLRQVWDYWRGRPPADVPFQVPGLYRYVRHPLMLGLLLAIWATPRLTIGRLLFNAGMTGYILLALRWEERDLRRRLGAAYDDYRRRVPLLLPWKGRLP
ncbi:MAG: methyltransferase family protein [Gemmataceae bacterium]